MQYKVIKKLDSDTLEHEIEELLNQGWQLQGGVAVSQKFSGGTSVSLAAGAIEYCQAVVLDIKHDVNQR